MSFEQSGHDIFIMKPKGDYSFWTKYKRFANTDILKYLVMIIGTILCILIFS